MSRCSSSCTSAASWSWIGRVDDKDASGRADSACYAVFPTELDRGPGQVHLAWFDDRNGNPVNHESGWNVWYRYSADGGATWTPGQRISAYMPCEKQSGPKGFVFPYGDYMRMELNPACGGQPFLACGEGLNWAGGASSPGHINFRSLC